MIRLGTAYGSVGTQLENLAHRLDEDHPGAAASVREGLVETRP
jgi:hypothetical protein